MRGFSILLEKNVDHYGFEHCQAQLDLPPTKDVLEKKMGLHICKMSRVTGIILPRDNFPVAGFDMLLVHIKHPNNSSIKYP